MSVANAVDTKLSGCVLDLAATLPVVISDTDAVYLYGLDIIAEQLASQRYYYMHDGLGSVRQLLDNTGQIATTYAYDPFGVPLASDTVPNPYRFTGEAWDAEVELLYLRARYYQPETGRFITLDQFRRFLSSRKGMLAGSLRGEPSDAGEYRHEDWPYRRGHFNGPRSDLVPFG